MDFARLLLKTPTKISGGNKKGGSRNKKAKVPTLKRIISVWKNWVRTRYIKISKTVG